MLAMAGGVAATSVEWPGSFVRLPGLRGYLSAHWDLELVVDLVFLVFGGVANCVIMLIVLQWIGLMPICVYFSLPWLRPTIAALLCCRFRVQSKVLWNNMCEFRIMLSVPMLYCSLIFLLMVRSFTLFGLCLWSSSFWWFHCCLICFSTHFTTSVVHFVLDHHSCQLS